MVSYDILHEKWISVLDGDGLPVQLSMMEVFERANELQSVAESNPLATYSVLRFLIGVLMDAFRPDTLSDLIAMERQGALDMNTIRSYIRTCREEGVTFDLFDRDRPFLQTPYNEVLDGKLPNGASRLMYHMPCGNNQTMLSHGHVLEKDSVLSVPMAFKGLLTHYCFLGTGGAGYYSNLNGAPCMYILIEGNSLFQTLIRNIPLREPIDIPYDDPPILWRCTQPTDRSEQTATSFLHGYMYPYRRMQLRPTVEKGRLVVRTCWYSPGHKFTNREFWTDPHMAYYYDQKDRRRPVLPSHGRKIWQDISAIAHQTAENELPQNVSNYIQAAREGLVSDSILRLKTYALLTGQKCTNYETMQESELQLPATLLNDPIRLNQLVDCIHFAEEKGGRLRFALRSACNFRAAKESDRVVFQRIIDQAQADFTAQAEQLFFRLLRRPTHSSEWKADIQSAALKSYDQFFDRFHMSGRSLYEAAHCRGLVYNKKEEEEEAS